MYREVKQRAADSQIPHACMTFNLWPFCMKMVVPIKHAWEGILSPNLKFLRATVLKSSAQTKQTDGQMDGNIPVTRLSVSSLVYDTDAEYLLRQLEALCLFLGSVCSRSRRCALKNSQSSLNIFCFSFKAACIITRLTVVTKTPSCQKDATYCSHTEEN